MPGPREYEDGEGRTISPGPRGAQEAVPYDPGGSWGAIIPNQLQKQAARIARLEAALVYLVEAGARWGRLGQADAERVKAILKPE